MKRREFITLLGGTVVGWPIGARAQNKSAAIGMLGSGFADSSAILLDAFKEGLRENGLTKDAIMSSTYAGRKATTRALRHSPPN
jgi:putative tryptophan/tyrosine transport system substrate-binding protein